MSFSNAVENAILRHLLGIEAWAAPPALWLALTVVPVTEADTGSTIAEPTYTGYERLLVEAADMDAPVSGATSNAQELVFPECAAGLSNVVGWALVDAVTDGNVVMYGDCAPVEISVSQSPPTIPAGGLALSVD
jgi:hypothetical protein